MSFASFHPLLQCPPQSSLPPNLFLCLCDKTLDQKQPEGGWCLIQLTDCGPSSRETPGLQGRGQKAERKQRPWRPAVHRLAPMAHPACFLIQCRTTVGCALPHQSIKKLPTPTRLQARLRKAVLHVEVSLPCDSDLCQVDKTNQKSSQYFF